MWRTVVSPKLGDFYLSQLLENGNWLVQQLRGMQTSFFEVSQSKISSSLLNTEMPYFLDCFKDDDGNLWLTNSNNGITYRSTSDSIKFSPFNIRAFIPRKPIKQLAAVNIYTHEQELYWYKNQNDFFVFSKDNKLLYDFKENYSQILNSDILNIFFDKQGNAWVATNFGVYQIRLVPVRFKNYISLPLGQYSVKDAKSIRGIHLNGKELWVNTVIEKSYIVNTQTNKIRSLITSTPTYTNHHIFIPILHLQDSEYLTFSNELVHYKDGQPIANYVWKKEEFFNFAWSLHKDTGGQVWIGTYEKGLAYLDRDSLTYFKNYNDFKDLQQSSIYHFLQWDNEHILIASSSGMYILHLKKGIIAKFSKRSKNKKQRIIFDDIYHIHRGLKEKDLLWLATDGGGIIRIKINQRDWSIIEQKQLSTVNGLPNNVVYAIYEDKQHNLWMSSDLGISCYNQETELFRNYTTNEGLPFNEFNKTAHFQAKDGQLFFGSMNGIASFYPENLLGNMRQSKAPFWITEVQQFNGRKEITENVTANFLESNKIILQPKDKFLFLKFALLEYDNPNQIKYSYQIDGQGENWFLLNEPQLRLSNLPFGKNILKIKAQGVSNYGKPYYIEIPIHVLPPIYLRWWFLSLLILIVGVGIYYFIEFRTRYLRERKKELQKLVNERTEELEKDKAVIEKQALELKQLDTMKTQFFANISHELRTPLTLILASIDNSLRANKLNKRDYINFMLARNGSQQLNKMINEILDLYKLEAGNLEVYYEPTVLYHFVKKIATSFESVANQKDIRFIFDYQGDQSLQFEIDNNKLKIIISNLLSNAFKFTSKGGEVDLLTIDAEHTFKLIVKDNGRGISTNDLPNIFNRFYQSAEKNGRVQGGTGIGLALTKELVELLGGAIKVKSELHEGSTFTVELPKRTVLSQMLNKDVGLVINEQVQPNFQESFEKQVITTSTDDKKATILLVEDNIDLQFFIKSILSAQYHVITAENGKEGLEKLEQTSCQLIISDLMMPIMDGYEFVEKVKSNNRFNQLPIIILTARSAVQDRVKALRIGVDDYLNKPFVEEELFVRINNLLLNAQSRRNEVEEIQSEIKLDDEVEEIAKSDKSTATPEMMEWLESIEIILLNNIEFKNYSLDNLADDAAISRRQLTRRIKSLVGLSAGEYVKLIRYTKAREFLETRRYSTVKAVAYAVGFKDVVNFSKQFKERFGKPPSEYL